MARINMESLNKNKIVIAGLIIITLFVLGYIEGLALNMLAFFSSFGSDTEFQIIKMKVVSNTVVNITPEELSKYPALESALNGEVCVDKGGYYKQITRVQNPIGAISLCKVTPDDKIKIENFIFSKMTKVTTPSCFKFGEKYGDTCYAFAFARP